MAISGDLQIGFDDGNEYGYAAGFRAGAEAMRAVAAEACDEEGEIDPQSHYHYAANQCAKIVRALALPEVPK